MRKFLNTLAGMMILVWGCASMQSGEPTSSPTGVPSKPVISQAFAAKEMRSGDTWKVYLNASDPDGNMKYIIANVNQFGNAGGYPVTFIRLKGENTREFSGFIYLNTNQSAHSGLMFTNLTMTVEIKNKTGITSQPMTFPLHFAQVKQELPPPGVFQEKELGPVMIRIEPANTMD